MAVEPNCWMVIYNPRAGSRKVKKRWKAIREYMDSKQIQYDYVQSEGFGSVERLARTAANNGYRTIVVVGGDGALNDALNGIMNSNVENKTDVTLGIIPNGIGNDFAKYWGLDKDDYQRSVYTLVRRRVRKVDLGKVCCFDGEKHVSRYFINAMYLGLGARIVRITNETRRFWGIPLLSYIASLFLMAFERKLHRMHL